ncbi:glycerate kinase [Microcella sp.]|uniref:glycerate kinase n=1 Tax=Microcella sp. TaxID=1913979 RepID=UPI00255D8AAB|nr:glycerate kinase [Microcella sp.]MBX9472505.1 glycerate kinase [Microcella sp.]
MRVVFAPDSLKGTATAAEAARALAEGWRSIRPHDEIVLAPMADGGEGTVDAVAAALPAAELRRTRVTGPATAADERDVEARWLLLPPEPDGSRTALVELAEASGLLLLDDLAPLTAHTLGFGQVIAVALAAGADRVLLALGGSCSTDGGAGALRALGVELLDDANAPVPLGNAGLHSLARVDLGTAVAPPVAGALVLSDVDNPLLGSRGAVAVFGSQKGLDVSLAPDAERALDRFATAIDPAGTLAATPGAGAAGGTGFGMLAWGAAVTSGSRAIAEAIGLPESIAGAQLVVTGEGRFDGQSAGGKAPVEVARQARKAGVPCALVAGTIDASPVEVSASRFDVAIALDELAGSTAVAMADPLTWLRAAGERLAAAHGR